MATINSKIEGVDVLGVVTAGETIYVGRATSAQHGIVKPAATDFLFDSQTNALLVKLGVGLKRTADGIAIAIYDGSVVTDILLVEGGLEIKYADIDEGTENSKVIPWSELTADEIEYLKKYFNIEPGTGEVAVQQVGAKATGPHSAAFGSRRYDKPTDESRRITEAKGGNAFAAGGSVTADGDFTAAFGKETQAEQSASFAAGTKTQAGKTLEEYIAAGGKAEDYAKSYAAAAVFGDGNKAKGYADFAAGNANESDGTSNTTVGGANKVKGTRNFTGGEANEVGQSGSSDVGNALTFGQHLKNTGRWNRVTFGQFNADDLAALFEIGNGTSDTNRVNIFVIKDNGAVYTGKLGKIHQGTRFQVSDGNSESDRRALIDSRHNGVTHIESYMSTLNGSVGNGNKVASSESGELKDIADPTDGNYPLLNTFLAGQGLQNKGRFNQVIVGQFNEFDALALFQVGTGESDTNRKKGFRVDYAGRAKSDTAAAGDDFYVRVADLGENVVFPYGEHSIDYDATKNGLTITGTMRIYVKKTASDDTSVYHDIPNVSMSVPIKAGNNMIIDKAEDGDWLVVSTAYNLPRAMQGYDYLGSVPSKFSEFLYDIMARTKGTYYFDVPKTGVSTDKQTEFELLYNNLPQPITLGTEDFSYYIVSDTENGIQEERNLVYGALHMYTGTLYIVGRTTKSIYSYELYSSQWYPDESGVDIAYDYAIKATGGATIDADTLNGLLSGSNGIAIAKNATGEKIEIKTPIKINETIISSFQQRESVTVEFMPVPGDSTSQVGYTDYKFYKGSSGNNQGFYSFKGFYLGNDDGEPISKLLYVDGPLGNVKTLFGNQQSIYGSGNIDLYRHNIHIAGETTDNEVWCNMIIISSNNMVVDSLTDLYTLCNGMGDLLPISGLCKLSSVEGKGVAILCRATASGGIYWIGSDNASRLYTWGSMPTLTITDTVTTV